MKKSFSLSVAVFLSISLLAQPGKKAVNQPKAHQHINVFNLAMQSGDISTAIMALNYYIAEQGSNSPYADTLAIMYMQAGAYPQCYYWSDNRLAAKPDDTRLMELKAICLDKLGQPKQAIDLYEKLFMKSKSPYHAYKLMELQYGIKRLAECIATANAAERLEFKPDMVMTYSVGEQLGRTYLQAGIYNVHGLALYDLDKKAEAKAYFEKAVALDSNFVLARQNIEAMKVEAASGNKNATPNNNTPGASPANKNNP
jgi:tetratricopeptide (TPR) repeat protein